MALFDYFCYNNICSYILCVYCKIPLLAAGILHFIYIRLIS